MENSDTMSTDTQKPKLYYLPIRGAVQPICFLFAYLDMEFDEETALVDKELKSSFNSGYPRIVHGNIVLTEPFSIFKYVAKIGERKDLLGLTPQNRAVINQFLFYHDESKKTMMTQILDSAKEIWKNKDKASSLKLQALKVIIEQKCPLLIKTIKMYMQTKGWLLGYATIMDFFFYQICFYLCNFLGSIIVNHPIYRNFNQYRKFFQRQDFFTQLKRENTKKIFMNSKDQSKIEFIKFLWEGDQTILV